MKKLTVLIVAGLLMCLAAGSLLAGGAKEETSEKPEIVIKLAHNSPVESPRHKGTLKFKELAEKNSNGQIKVELYPAAQLGNEGEVFEAVQIGTLQATQGGSFETSCPKLNLYLMPFLFRNYEEAIKVTSSSFADEIVKDAAKNGVIILATGYSGFRQFSNNVRPIEKLEDIKGLRMRVPPIPSIVKIMEALEADPVSIPYTETYMGLKNNLADGQENSVVNTYNMKFYEVLKYMSIANYQFHPEPFHMNLQFYNSLSPELQKVVSEAAKGAIAETNAQLRAIYDHALEVMKEAGMKVNYISESELQRFREKTASVCEEYIKEGYFTQAELDKVLSIAKQ